MDTELLVRQPPIPTFAKNAIVDSPNMSIGYKDDSQNLIRVHVGDGTQEGEYFIIQYTPQLTEEVFNIGVCVIDNGNEFHLKMLKDFSVISQLWVNADEIFTFLFEDIQHVLGRYGYPTSPSPRVSYSKIRPVMYETVQEAADDLYRKHITLDPTRLSKSTNNIQEF